MASVNQLLFRKSWQLNFWDILAFGWRPCYLVVKAGSQGTFNLVTLAVTLAVEPRVGNGLPLILTQK